MLEKIQKYWSVLVCCAGLACSFGVMQYRLDIQDIAIQKLEAKQNTTETMLSSISEQLASISTKMDLILSGKVTVKVAKE